MRQMEALLSTRQTNVSATHYRAAWDRAGQPGAGNQLQSMSLPVSLEVCAAHAAIAETMCRCDLSGNHITTSSLDL